MRAALLLLTGLAAAVPAHARMVPAPAAPVVAPPEAPGPGHGWMGPGRHRHPHRGGQNAYAGYGGYGFADYADEAPGGFFEDGEAVPTPDGVRYLYDRSYPYDYYRPARARSVAWQEPEAQACSARLERAVMVHSCRR